eukprot:scaffold28095_cov44-Skeletonema_dohrnii-CCMP3373.AAC.1
MSSCTIDRREVVLSSMRTLRSNRTDTKRQGHQYGSIPSAHADRGGGVGLIGQVGANIDHRQILAFFQFPCFSCYQVRAFVHPAPNACRISDPKSGYQRASRQ